MGTAVNANPYETNPSKHRGKRVKMVLPVLASLLAIGLLGKVILNRPSVPVTGGLTVPVTSESNLSPATNIETIIETTPPPPVQEEKAVLQWDGSSPNLSYKKGDVSWVANIGEGIEEAMLRISGKFMTPRDFFIYGALVEERYGHVIAWGKTHIKYLGKVSFRGISSGYEDSAYWTDGTSLNELLVVYDVPTEKGLKDYLVIAGDTAKTSMLNAAGKVTNLSTRELPVIEIRELTPHGSILVTHNPVTYVNGSATGVKAVRDENGNVTLEIATRTRTNPKGGVSSVKLTDILELEKEAPIFGGY